jgi:O-antigen ligase
MYAHNIFVEIAADMGAAGLVVFGATLVLAGVYAVRVLRAPEGQEAKPYTLLALTLLAFDLVEAQVSANLGTNSIIWFDIGMITALHTAVFSRLWKEIWPASRS